MTELGWKSISPNFYIQANYLNFILNNKNVICVYVWWPRNLIHIWFLKVFVHFLSVSRMVNWKYPYQILKIRKIYLSGLKRNFEKSSNIVCLGINEVGVNGLKLSFLMFSHILWNHVYEWSKEINNSRPPWLCPKSMDNSKAKLGNFCLLTVFSNDWEHRDFIISRNLKKPCLYSVIEV